MSMRYQWPISMPTVTLPSSKRGEEKSGWVETRFDRKKRRLVKTMRAQRQAAAPVSTVDAKLRARNACLSVHRETM